MPPALSFAAFCFIGLVTLLLSFVAQTNAVVDPRTNKLFGYLYEINWAVNYVLIIPVAVYFCTAAINGMSQVITELAQARMIVRDDGVAASADDIKGSWDSYAGPALYAAGLLGIIATIASMIEWWVDCVHPLSYTSLASIPPTLAPGWNLTSLLSKGQASRLGVAAFGLVAFAGQAAVATAFLSFITLVLAFASWVFRYTGDDSTWELFPNPASADARRGFEHFEIFIENLLLAALALFIVFFMTRLQYLYNDSGAHSIVAFAGGDIARGFFQGLKKLIADADPGIFTAGKRIAYSTAMVGAGAGVTVILAFLVPAIVVRQAAMRSRARLLDWMDAHPDRVSALYGINSDEVRKKLQSMVIWPMRYPKPIELLVFIVVAALCFICYKFALILLGTFLGFAIKEVAKIFRSAAPDQNRRVTNV
jgi:hypothetical protein